MQRNHDLRIIKNTFEIRSELYLVSNIYLKNTFFRALKVCLNINLAKIEKVLSNTCDTRDLRLRTNKTRHVDIIQTSPNNYLHLFPNLKHWCSTFGK